MIRELVGGLYFGKKERGLNSDGERYVVENLEYKESEIRQILVVAFQQAQKRKKIFNPVTNFDKGFEKMIRAYIVKSFPNDGIIGEEFKEKKTKNKTTLSNSW